MADLAVAAEPRVPQYGGLRMTAEEYFQLEDDGFKYELVDGVIVMAPAPTPGHQGVAMEIISQIAWFLRDHPVGKLLHETDVQLGPERGGAKLVYRPEVVFFRKERVAGMKERLVGAPDLVVEVISPRSRRMDSETKKDDYERAGVHEYWMIDPQRQAMTFYRLDAGRFVESRPTGDRLASEAVPGFSLDLARVRESFKPW